MKQFLFFFLVITCSALSSLAQDSPRFDLETLERVSPSIVALTWDAGIYHSKNREPRTVYVLLNVGSIKDAPIAKNFGELVKSWLVDHHDAEAIVTNMIPGRSDYAGWTFKPVWVKDHDEFLNVYLVRKGACPAISMVLSASLETPLTPDQVKSIHKMIYVAEELATKEKLGIWADAK